MSGIHYRFNQIVSPQEIKKKAGFQKEEVKSLFDVRSGTGYSSDSFFFI